LRQNTNRNPVFRRGLWSVCAGRHTSRTERRQGSKTSHSVARVGTPVIGAEQPVPRWLGWFAGRVELRGNFTGAIQAKLPPLRN
jgi:hypothetical protein